VVADGDFVLVHINWKDRPADRGSAVVDIYRLENGRLVEPWDVVQPNPKTLPHNNTMF
jgi:predicted SnoaL-like aldol condensation-catalyzing enzyme